MMAIAPPVIVPITKSFTRVASVADVAFPA